MVRSEPVGQVQPVEQGERGWDSDRDTWTSVQIVAHYGRMSAVPLSV